MVSQEPLFLARRMRQPLGSLVLLTSPPSLASLAPSQFFFCHAFPPWALGGDQQWRIRFPPSRPKSDLCFHISNLGVFSLRMSRCFGDPVRTSLPALYLDFLQGVGEFSIFWRKGAAERFLKESYLRLRTCIPYSLWHFVKDSLWLHHTYHRGIHLFGGFTHYFYDGANGLFPYRRTNF